MLIGVILGGESISVRTRSLFFFVDQGSFVDLHRGVKFPSSAEFQRIMFLATHSRICEVQCNIEGCSMLLRAYSQLIRSAQR